MHRMQKNFSFFNAATIYSNFITVKKKDKYTEISQKISQY